LVECLAIEHEIAARGLSEAALTVSGGQARPDLVVPWVTTASAFGDNGDPARKSKSTQNCVPNPRAARDRPIALASAFSR
jgi:hypothetical protein